MVEEKEWWETPLKEYKKAVEAHGLDLFEDQGTEGKSEKGDAD